MDQKDAEDIPNDAMDDNHNDIDESALRSLESETISYYRVELLKGTYGLGIYFKASSHGHAIVDVNVPFYRLPDDSEAPGEASGMIAPGDRLVQINDMDVRESTFQTIVEQLRCVPTGVVLLHFERSTAYHSAGNQVDNDDRSNLEQNRRTLPSALSKLFTRRDGSMSVSSPETTMLRSAAMEELLVDMENKCRILEESVEREKKCRFLAEKKNILYRNALRTMGEENAQLRYQLTKAQQQLNHRNEFEQSLGLLI